MPLSGIYKKHGGKFDLTRTVYVNKRTKITVLCNDCGSEITQLKGNIISIGCANCNKISRDLKRKSDWVLRSKAIHGNKYCYDESNYVDGKTPVKIWCIEGGHFFEKSPLNHSSKFNRQGCSICSDSGKALSYTERVERFSYKSNKLFCGNLSLFIEDYVDSSTKIRMFCKKHNVFCSQTPASNIVGKTPCFMCLKELKIKAMPSPYNNTKAYRGDFCFKSYLYVIYLFDNLEHFVKVGVTKDLRERLKCFRTAGYSVAVINSKLFTSCNDAIIREQEIRGQLRDNSYVPKRLFKGYTECFDRSVVKVLFPPEE